MNENLNLVEILKDCPKGTKLYSPLLGDAYLLEVKEGDKYSIYVVPYPDEKTLSYEFDSRGRFFADFDGECMLYPSRKQRDWSRFRANVSKFDPKTLQPFDKVLVRSENIFNWNCSLFSNIDDQCKNYPFGCLGTYYRFCIPYNDETKHLVGTTEEAPEFYRCWED